MISALGTARAGVALPPQASAETTRLAQTTTFSNSGQADSSICSVDCGRSDSRETTAHLLWNADTGELMRAGQSDSGVSEHGGEFDTKPSSAPQKPSVSAWDWFHAMKIDRPLRNMARSSECAKSPTHSGMSACRQEIGARS